ncbi:MAG: hypothetical protein WCC28_12950 [Mycobacterium sp.]|uniref:hypothetical protein n=1 Tax=Mycobacterium sp. TaxID=1785 RepID=UPI003C706740
MKHASRIRRIGGLAVGLGIGTALATIPWIALADPFPPPFDPNNYAVSMDGMTLFQVGSAHAFSAFGDFAIADGADSDASAIGFGDAASAYGPNSFAQAGGSEGSRSFDFASAEGSNSTAFAGSDGSYDSANAIGTSSNAFAGSGGSYDTAYAFGDQVQADAGIGATDNPANYDFASAVGNLTIPTSSLTEASATGGSNDLAFVIDPLNAIERAGVPLDVGSSALAGDHGNFDIAGALGDDLHAISTMADSIFHVAPFF